MAAKFFDLFDVVIETVVVGQNYERADCSNPQGHIFGEAVSVRASNRYGDTKVLFVGIDDGGDMIRKASSMVVGLNARAASGREPVAFDTWKAGRALYGSEAYTAYGADDDAAWEANQDA